MDDPFIIQHQDNVKDARLNQYTAGSDEGNFYSTEKGTFDSLRISISWPRLRMFFIIVMLALSVLVLRVFYLQIIEGNYYRTVAEGNRIRIKPIKAVRGIIYDRQGKILVRNVPNFSLFFIPGDLPREEDELTKILNTISDILESPTLYLRTLLGDVSPYSYEPLLVAENISHSKTLLLEIETSMIPGVFLETRSRREYLFSDSDYGLSHILGYTGKLSPEEYQERKNKGYLLNDYIGKTGIEYNYEFYLRGQDGKKRIEVDFLGKEEKIVSFSPPKDGQSLVLSIDLDLQKKISEILQKQLRQIKKTKGVVIVTEVNSGEILALVSVPSYDNNLFARGISRENYEKLINDESEPLFNRAIAGEYPPGSTIKPVLAAAALEEEIINENTTFISTGGIWLSEWFFPDWKAGGHGRINVTQAIAESVNTFFYYIGGGHEEFKGLGLEKINYWSSLFGFGRDTKIDLPGEGSGFLPTKQWKMDTREEPWYIGDTYHLAIGQGDILVTPIQVANFTAVIANDGTLYRPHLLKNLLHADNETASAVQNEILRTNIAQKKNLEIVRQGMRGAVVYGSSQSLADLPIAVAGKTGTAQVGGEKDPHAWFTGFAPYENPEIAITILIENGGEGSRVAVPIAKEILQYYFGQ
ncbi:penicillin-binding protein 2 [Patescibacteria group bacterium]|nr:penicillin-binding protein 2 [Patescibacteria group bacterium]